MGNFAISALSVVKPSQYSARAAAAGSMYGAFQAGQKSGGDITIGLSDRNNAGKDTLLAKGFRDLTSKLDQMLAHVEGIMDTYEVLKGQAQFVRDNAETLTAGQLAQADVAFQLTGGMLDGMIAETHAGTDTILNDATIVFYDDLSGGSTTIPVSRLGIIGTVPALVGNVAITSSAAAQTALIALDNGIDNALEDVMTWSMMRETAAVGADLAESRASVRFEHAAAKLDVDIALAGAEVARLAATEQSINLMLAKVTSGFDNAVGILSRM